MVSFFSTDGAEPEKKDENVFDDISKTENAEANQTKDHSGNSKVHKVKEMFQMQIQNLATLIQISRGMATKVLRNLTGKMKNPKNKPRPKFKKPKKLPYEDTESKALEIGNLLEYEDLKTEEGFPLLLKFLLLQTVHLFYTMIFILLPCLT